MGRNHVWIALLTCLFFAGCESNKETIQDSPIEQVITINEIPDHSIVVTDTGWNKEAFHTFTNILPDKRSWIPLAIDLAGTFIGSVPEQLGKPYQMILLDSVTGKYETIAELSTKGAQCAGADINESYVVWSEALDQSFVNWNMHVYDRKTKKDRIVYKSHKDSKGNGYPGPIWVPDLEGNEFVFSPAVGPMTERGHDIKVLKVSADSGQVTEIAAPAGNPRIKKEYMIWVGRDPNSGAPELFWNRGGNVQQITKGEIPAYFDSHEETYAWSNYQDFKWHVRLFENGEIREIATATSQDEWLQWVTMSDKLLTWQSTLKTQVYDRTRDKVVTLNGKPPLGLFVNENFLFWSVELENGNLDTKVGQARMFLVDLSKI